MTATECQNDQEIILGDHRFPLKGKVRTNLISRYPQRMNFADNSIANELLLSNWSIDDQTGGCLIEELTDLKRYLWSNCNVKHRKHMTLPGMPTQIAMPDILTITDGDMEIWSDANTLTHWTKSSSGSWLTRYTSDYFSGTCCARIYNSGTTNHISQEAVVWNNSFRGTTVTVTARIKAYDNQGFLYIWDGVGRSSVAHSGGGAWEFLTVTRKLSDEATCLRIECGPLSIGATSCYVDSVILSMSNTVGGPFCEFNDDLYFASRLDTSIYKISGSTGNIYFVASLIQGSSWFEGKDYITDMIVFGEYLLIGLDDNKYFFMDTNEVFTRTDVSGAYRWVVMDSTHLGKIDVDGHFYYSTAPAVASPSWTANGSITDLGTDSVSRLITGPDAAGNTIVYAATTRGVYAHDYTNAKFVATGVRVPASYFNGRGFHYWAGAIWYSHGLGLIRYVPQNGTVDELGLNNNDGLAGWEDSAQFIRKITSSGKYLYIATGPGNTTPAIRGYFGVYEYDGIAWHKKYNTLSYCYDMIFSFLYRNRLYIGTSGGLYYISEYDNPLPPKKIEGFTFDSFGRHITPWFDAGAPTFKKVATRVQASVAGSSASEKIKISYRIDHANPNALCGGTCTNGTGACTGSPVTLSTLNTRRTTITVTVPGTFNIYLPAGCTAVVTSGTSTVTGSPVPLIAGTTQIAATAGDFTIDWDWTALGTITADGWTEYLYGSGAGLLFRSIQFMFELERGATTTLSPDLLAFLLSYKLDDFRWQWQFQVDCTDKYPNYGNLTPRQREDALRACKTDLLQYFTFRNSTGTSEKHWVEIVPPFGGEDDTGNNYNGIWTVTVVEL